MFCQLYMSTSKSHFLMPGDDRLGSELPPIAREIALHEAGHVVAALALRAAVCSVAIQPRDAFSLGASPSTQHTQAFWPEDQTERTTLSGLIYSVAGYIAGCAAYDGVKVSAGARQRLLSQMREQHGRGDFETAQSCVTWLLDR